MEHPHSNRFWEKVDRQSLGCWLWTAATSVYGYGLFFHEKKSRRAHRVGYELIKGKIPKGMQLDHLCRVRNCVNPDHLEIVDNKENVRRGMAPQGINYRKTHCIRDHELSGENLKVTKNGRECKKCRRIFSKRYKDKKKAESVKKIRLKKTICSRGHPLIGANVMGEKRRCRECSLLRKKKYNNKLKELQWTAGQYR